MPLVYLIKSTIGLLIIGWHGYAPDSSRDKRWFLFRYGYCWRILAAPRLYGSRLLWGYKRRAKRPQPHAYSAIVTVPVNSPTVSVTTTRPILAHHKLTPWRHHLWLSPRVPRDARFVAQVREIIDLYTRLLAPWEAVICVDENTNLQPRPRLSPTRPACLGAPGQPGQPVRVEHEYRRCGALNLFAGFDTRSGHVYARTARRKRQGEFIAFLEHLDREVPATVTTLHLVMDNLPMHNGRKIQAWLATHPRFQFHFPPVHCSWMNQVEQWFSILQRKRLRIADFADLDHLAARLYAFVAEWNEHAHPFNWSSKSAAKVMAACEEAPQDFACAA